MSLTPTPTDLFTRNGKALAVAGDDVFDRAGRHVARRHGDLFYGPDGRYAGTLIGDRVVFRAVDDVSVRPPFAPRWHAGSAQADRPRIALRGDEPFPAPAHDVGRESAVVGLVFERRDARGSAREHRRRG